MKPKLAWYGCSFNYNLKLPISKIGHNSLFPGFRYYSRKSHPQPFSSDPQPILTLYLNNEDCIKSYESILRGKGGIYSLVNTVNGKRYIGSAKDFFIRLNQHLKYKNSAKKKKKNFFFCVKRCWFFFLTEKKNKKSICKIWYR